MLIATLGLPTSLDRVFSYDPYIWASSLVYDTTSTWWTTVYGAPAESQSTSIQISGLVVNSVSLAQVESVADVVAQQNSWYFDVATQKLYIHLDHSTEGTTAVILYGRVIGFSDTDVVDIGGVEYLPLIQSAPSLNQVQDPVKSNNLAFMNGALVLKNAGGVVDFLLDESIIGSDATMGYLPDSAIINDQASPSDVIPLATFFAEGYAAGISEFRISLQDKRRAQNAVFPATRFAVSDYANLDDDTIDRPIPVVYGYQRELRAYPTNGKAASTTVRYRAGLLLTALTTVYLKIADKWTVSTPSNINLATGEFDVVGAKSSTTAAPYACKVEATGIAVTYASDVIKDLNNRYAGIPFNDSNYDTAEWNQEQTSLVTVGIVFSDTTTIFDAVPILQSGANVPFRYEINADGKRTIRIDRADRAALPGVDVPEILDSETLLVDVTSEFLAAQVRIGYQLSDESGRYLTVLDATQSSAVLAAYRSKAEVRFDTLLTTLAHATTRAFADAVKYAVPISTVELTFRGERYLSIRILDIITVAITNDAIDIETDVSLGRKFLGVQKCKVIGVAPDYQAVQNQVELQLLGPIVPYRPDSLVYADEMTQMVTSSGDPIITGGF